MASAPPSRVQLLRLAPATLWAKIERYVSANIEHSMKGAKAPSDLDELEEELEAAKRSLENYIQKGLDKGAQP